ncbi:MAG: NUDIX hydrolase [Candidatus Kerfeldbacteria bacterium]
MAKEGEILEQDVTEKAGGIIVRTNDSGAVELYLIHRPRYDDWSVPKGHIDEGETPLQAALREVAEETGMHCSVERPLPPYFYQTPGGENVAVHFYEMKMIGEGHDMHDDEVDKGEWKSPEEAMSLISYPSLKTYITELYSG